MVKSLHFHSTRKAILALRVSSLFFLFSSLSSHGHPIKAHIFIYAGCSQEKFQPSSPFEGNLNSFLSSLVSSSSQALYNSFSMGNGSSSTPADAAVYGLYQCRGDLKILDCSRCIESAVNQIGLVCPYSYGASLQLEGCYVRYEHFDFLGKIDTSLRYKKCSKSVSNDVEFFRRRDDVLADLQGAISFRVSSSGLVEGFAHCVGDLNPTDCSSCLADAVGKLKTLCGSAAAADVFLAQCYVRYWASGYYDLSSDSSNEDDVGKTVAIIVGVLAGIAVLIVLLSICRKAMSNNCSY
ncbi:Gnk2-like domain containing protein [Trema orientale]|uniref:Gnk2-like domain containing protein n=1 Tax=Trema orientale TaxID=63057 RepID=A0A2P5CLH2_TREOI|nr:Gnk2-like domain containing protein [Trema orientale]